MFKNSFRSKLSLLLVLLIGISTFSLNAEEIKPLPLEKSFSRLEKLGLGKVSIYVKDLKSGETFGIHEDYIDKNGDAGMCAASVIKMHVAYCLVKDIEEGKLSWNKTYRDPVNGRKFTIKEEMKRMIVVSDNNSYNTFLRFLTPKKINEKFLEMGLENTKVYSEIGPAGYGWSKKNNVMRYGIDRGGRINALETAKVLELIYKEKNQKDMAILHRYMTEVTNTKRIPAAVGKGVVVAHKTGTVADADGIFNDSGIVYGKNSHYLFVILTQNQKYGIDLVIRKAVKDAFATLESRKKQ